MRTVLPTDTVQAINERLSRANGEVASLYPGETARRQPVHTVYGGAHLFKADTARRLGALALRSLTEFAPDAQTFARAVSMFSGEDARDASSQNSKSSNDATDALAETIYARVVEKLKREPVEDFRIDFEDGYGNRPDAEEDGHAESAAAEVARGLADGTLPPYIGIRIKPFTEELRARSFRTLDIFLSTLVEQCGGQLPPNFVVTLPKITSSEQVAALADIYDSIEPQLGLAPQSLRFEMMIETTQSIFDPAGRVSLPLLVQAARGRCNAAHFGTYDYTAACQITAAHQHMTHPACDFAKHVMQVTLAGTGLWLSDGATNIMPVAPHRATEGQQLTNEQTEENRRTVQRAWRIHFEHARHSLTGGFYQGWDLHPAQLPTRYAAVYSFFLESLDAASERLKNFVEKAAKATLVGDVFDDAATGQGLLNYFLRATNCGAITEDEATERSGLTPEELRSGSFVKILKGRQG
jgi:citrate lyase beta subunit